MKQGIGERSVSARLAFLQTMALQTMAMVLRGEGRGQVGVCARFPLAPSSFASGRARVSWAWFSRAALVALSPCRDLRADDAVPSACLVERPRDPLRQSLAEDAFPPNDWKCSCGVDTLSDADLHRLGLTPADAPNDGTETACDPASDDMVEVRPASAAAGTTSRGGAVGKGLGPVGADGRGHARDRQPRARR